jgi:hypothetical protein
MRNPINKSCSSRIDRRSFTKFLGSSAVVAGLSSVAGATSTSTEPEIEVVGREVLEDTDSYTVVRSRIKEIKDFSEEIRTFVWKLKTSDGTIQGTDVALSSETVESGGVVEVTDESIDLEQQFSDGDDGVSSQDHWVPGYDWVLEDYKEFKRDIADCNHRTYYDHNYGGVALELTGPMHSFSKTFVAGLITAVCGAAGAAAGAILGGVVGAALGALGGGLIGALAGAVWAVASNKPYITVGVRDYDELGEKFHTGVVANKWDPDVHYMLPGSPIPGHID